MEEKKTLKEQLEDLKVKAKWKFDGAKIWCENHKAEITVFGPVILGGLVEIAKIVAKRHNVNEEKRLKDNYIYDRSMGHYYELKRKPKNSEWLEIERRKDRGETLGWILQDMRLLK